MNRNRKRIMAGAMAVVVSAGAVGAYGCHGSGAEVLAEEETTEILEEAANAVLEGGTEESEISGDTGKNQSGDAADCSGGGEEGGVFKEESVYVKADAQGNVSKTTVTEWIKNPESGQLADISGLKDIRNIKGEEEFSKGSGKELTWKSEGSDIYYQGTTDEKLPVDVNISYKLDGKDIKAEDLAGKDGKVEIHIEYDNHAKENVEIDGENVEMYTPFTMVTSMMLPTDEYSNVTIDNGKILSDADKNIVVGLGFPGLSENLKLKELDLDIPESVTITADVKDASVGPTITVASTEIMEEFDLSDVHDFDSLEDSIHELEDASAKLEDGSKEASDGADQLADGSKSAADGAKELADGAKEAAGGAKELADGSKSAAAGAKELRDGSRTLADGVNELNSKSGELTKGVNTLAEGMYAYTDGVSGLKEGSEAIAGGASALSEGAGSLNAGIAQASAGAGQLAAGAQAVRGGMGEVASGLGNASAGLQSLAASLRSITGSNGTAGAVYSEVNVAGIVDQYFPDADEETRAAAAAAIEAQLDQICGSMNEAVNAMAYAADSKDASINAIADQIEGVGAGIQGAQAQLTTPGYPLVDGVSGIENGAASLAETLGGTGAIGGGAASLSAGADELAAGTAELKAGAERLYASNKPLLDGMNSLKEGGSKLLDGVGQLSAGASTLSAGAVTLSDGNQQLANGAGKLSDGNQQLAIGAGTLSDGTRQLADGAAALSDGNRQLADGMSEFKTSGIDRLTDVFDNDIQSVRTRIDTMSDLGKNYKSFAGIQEGMNGSTKFIIETEGVEK